MSVARKILLVDDDKYVRETCGSLLAAAGYDVEMAVDGLDALKKLKTPDFDLILLDINMPQLDGIDFYNSVIRTHPALKDKFLFITGDPTGELDALSGLIHEKVPYLIKPFSKDEFLQRINDMVCRKK